VEAAEAAVAVVEVVAVAEVVAVGDAVNRRPRKIRNEC